MAQGRVFVTAALLLWPAAAGADPLAGERLARLWCSACHAVDRGGASASASVPPFSWIARERSPEQQRAFLVSPHGGMPDFGLGRQEIDDLIAYIREQR